MKALEAVSLAAFGHRPVSLLSGGEKARALLARVLVTWSDWILADEPLAALGLRHQLTLLAQLRSAARGGASVVLVLHDLGLAMNHADWVVVLDRGLLVAEGASEEALSGEVIPRVWSVPASWLADRGTRALITT